MTSQVQLSCLETLYRVHKKFQCSSYSKVRESFNKFIKTAIEDFKEEDKKKAIAKSSLLPKVSIESRSEDVDKALDYLQEAMGVVLELEMARKAAKSSCSTEDLAMLQDIYKAVSKHLQSVDKKHLETTRFLRRDSVLVRRAMVILKESLLKSELTIFEQKIKHHKQTMAQLKLLLLESYGELNKQVSSTKPEKLSELQDLLQNKKQKLIELKDQKSEIVNVCENVLGDKEGCYSLCVDYIIKYPEEVGSRLDKEDLLELIDASSSEEVIELILNNNLKRKVVCILEKDAKKLKKEIQELEFSIQDCKVEIKKQIVVEDSRAVFNYTKAMISSVKKEFEESIKVSEVCLEKARKDFKFFKNRFVLFGNNGNSTEIERIRREEELSGVLSSYSKGLSKLRDDITKIDKDFEDICKDKETFVKVYQSALRKQQRDLLEQITLFKDNPNKINKVLISKLQERAVLVLELMNKKPLKDIYDDCDVNCTYRQEIVSEVVKVQSVMIKLGTIILEQDLKQKNVELDKLKSLIVDVKRKVVSCLRANSLDIAGRKKIIKDLCERDFNLLKLLFLEKRHSSNLKELAEIDKQYKTVAAHLLEHQVAHISICKLVGKPVEKHAFSLYDSEEALSSIRRRCYDNLMEMIPGSECAKLSEQEVEQFVIEEVMEEELSLHKKMFCLKEKREEICEDIVITNNSIEEMEQSFSVPVGVLKQELRNQEMELRIKQGLFSSKNKAQDLLIEQLERRLEHCRKALLVDEDETQIKLLLKSFVDDIDAIDKKINKSLIDKTDIENKLKVQERRRAVCEEVTRLLSKEEKKRKLIFTETAVFKQLQGLVQEFLSLKDVESCIELDFENIKHKSNEVENVYLLLA